MVPQGPSFWAQDKDVSQDMVHKVEGKGGESWEEVQKVEPDF